MLARIEQEFNLLEKKLSVRNQDDATNYHAVVSLVHNLINELEIEKNNSTKEELRTKLKGIRRIHAKSNFIKRLQEWPNGYQGDYETIEQICTVTNSVINFGIEYYLENYALNCFIAQQHRNKINIQAHRILEVVTKNKHANILICACGSSYDLRIIQQIIENSNFNLILNDLDHNALNYSQSKLKKRVLNKVTLDNKNVISTIRNIGRHYEKFDLVLFGGLFDYLSDKQIKFVLKNTYNHLTKKGQILFTNIAKNNPFKNWIEIIGNWELTERSNQQNIEICKSAGISTVKVKQYRDLTNLTNIIEIQN